MILLGRLPQLPPHPIAPGTQLRQRGRRDLRTPLDLRGADVQPDPWPSRIWRGYLHSPGDYPKISTLCTVYWGTATALHGRRCSGSAAAETDEKGKLLTILS